MYLKSLTLFVYFAMSYYSIWRYIIPFTYINTLYLKQANEGLTTEKKILIIDKSIIDNPHRIASCFRWICVEAMMKKKENAINWKGIYQNQYSLLMFSNAKRWEDDEGYSNGCTSGWAWEKATPSRERITKYLRKLRRALTKQR